LPKGKEGREDLAGLRTWGRKFFPNPDETHCMVSTRRRVSLRSRELLTYLRSLILVHERKDVSHRVSLHP
jgi:hypothetical protein